MRLLRSGSRLEQPGDLHAERRGARHDVTVAHELAERPAERQRIDSVGDRETRLSS